MRKKQEHIPVGCVLPACTDHTSYFNYHYISALGAGVIPQVNKFEQVFSLDHQISLPGGVPMSYVQRWVGLYSEVQCTMANGHMVARMNRQSDMTLPSRNIVGRR